MMVKFTVTQKDVTQGCYGDSNNCPVARSIVRVLKRNDIEVNGADIRIGEKYFNAPKIVSQFVDFFDNYCKKDMPFFKFKPFEFALNIPKNILESGEIF